jgi:DNA-binding transcriptional ArsR family regulator
MTLTRTPGRIGPVPGIEYVEAEDVRRTPFRVSVSPLPSLNSALRDAAGPPRSGTPPAWRKAIQSHITRQDLETLAPLVTPGKTLVPDRLVGLSEPPGESFQEGIERILSTPVELLAEEIASCRATTGNESWRPAERAPARWLRRYVTSLLRAWKGFGPVWRHARAELARETERVAMATARDAQLELVAGLLPEGAVLDGRWSLRCDFSEGRFRFPQDGLVLLPLVAGECSSIVTKSDDIVGVVGYPVRSLLGLPAAASTQAALEALLGAPRAEILRRAGAPTSIGRLAEALRSVPSVATHHVAALEAAGLVERDRRGRHVLVQRTGRGETLLQLYDPA